MGMGRRKHRQDTLWVATAELPRTAGHVFYERVNRILNETEFDRFVEDACEKFYAAVMGRPSLAPGKYFRMLLVGYFEGIDSERGDCMAVCRFSKLAGIPGSGTERRGTGSFDGFANPTADRSGDAWKGLFVDVGCIGR